jgi:hypothetical protein
MEDAKLIHPDFAVLENATTAVTTALERIPIAFQVFDSKRRLRVARILYHLVAGPSATHVEPLYVTFRIEQDPPSGLVSLRRIVTRTDLLGGLHVGTPDLPPPADAYPWPS